MQLIVVVAQVEARSISPSRLLDQALVYTGLTRGEEQAALVSNWNAVCAAIPAPATATQRYVNLQWLLDLAVAREESGSL
jgi:ATP-dependent exoDNAse (exonuclease V) alpha subunit